MIGAALGPVFSSCSPTYALIVATVLPQSFLSGLFYISVYVIGLALMLLLVAGKKGTYKIVFPDKLKPKTALPGP